MALRPQDVYVALKIVAAGHRAPYAQLASELGMSVSEIHASVRRARRSHLLHGPESRDRPNLASLEEFLLHGLQYAFPPEHGGLTRGIATSYAAEPLRGAIQAGDEPVPVWPSATGTERGMAFSPLYKTAPAAAMRDPVFYEYLVLADALRGGRARERRIAASRLQRLFKEANARVQS